MVVAGQAARHRLDAHSGRVALGRAAHLPVRGALHRRRGHGGSARCSGSCCAASSRASRFRPTSTSWPASGAARVDRRGVVSWRRWHCAWWRRSTRRPTRPAFRPPKRCATRERAPRRRRCSGPGRGRDSRSGRGESVHAAQDVVSAGPPARRHREGLSDARGQVRGAARGRSHGPPWHDSGYSRGLGHREEYAAACGGRPRPARRGVGLGGGPGPDLARPRRHRSLPCAAARVRLPVPPPAARVHRARERDAAGPVGGSVGVGSAHARQGFSGARRTVGTVGASAVAALGRRAATRRGGARHRQPSGADSRRRADGKPRS